MYVCRQNIKSISQRLINCLREHIGKKYETKIKLIYIMPHMDTYIYIYMHTYIHM